MTLDTLLSQPLAPLRDDGFSAGVLLRLRRADEKRRLLLWGAAILALLPLALVLPLPSAAVMVATALGGAAASPAFASAIGVVVLLWALRPVSRT